MQEATRLGIWMDHSIAHLIKFTANPLETTNIESEFTFAEKQASLSRSENLMHNKEQDRASSYYKKLGEIIKEYDEVLLFGPTNAKEELFNILKADLHFEDIKIDLEQSDKMTENQKHAFVRAHFSKQ